MFGFLLEVIYIVEERRDESWKVIYIYDTISYNIYIIIILREISKKKINKKRGGVFFIRV